MEPTNPCTEEILIMRPYLFSRINGMDALIAWNAAERLMAMMASHLSSGKLSTGATCCMPALLTSISNLPND